MLSFFAENFDLPILDWIAQHLWCPFLDAVMPVVTKLGNGGTGIVAFDLAAGILIRYNQLAVLHQLIFMPKA